MTLEYDFFQEFWINSHKLTETIFASVVKTNQIGYCSQASWLESVKRE